MKTKTIKFHVIGATRPETVKPDQTQFVAIMATQSGHCYQTLTSTLLTIEDVLDCEVETATGKVVWPPVVVAARKMGRISTQKYKVGK